jgi:hypothetical protein
VKSEVWIKVDDDKIPSGIIPHGKDHNDQDLYVVRA